ncbi:MAG TPA: hypothetical protein PLI95_16915 [Polyangiaceae bacterium]|nr:hypothetical protein [Polyangiaceae bacterium]
MRSAIARAIAGPEQAGARATTGLVLGEGLVERAGGAVNLKVESLTALTVA